MPKPYRYKFTVFTPVYNRAGALVRPWRSLCSQTYRDFEWIAIDDGSTDNGLEILRGYERAATFPVTVLTQPNGGKHTAWNRAVALAQGELFVPLDSDDECVPEALERMARIWDDLPQEERGKYSGINVLGMDGLTGETVGDPFPASPFDTNNLELKYVHRVRGEKWGCIRTDLLAAHPFPDEPLAPYFPETYVWFQLARHWAVRCVNERLRIIHRDQPNHVTSRTRKLNGLPCKFRYDVWHFCENFDYLVRDKREFAMTGANIWRLGLHLHRSPLPIARDLHHTRELLYASPLLPAGALLAMIDKVLGRV
jgi:glycosyltransferase involved in cell wall biosynthesis